MTAATDSRSPVIDVFLTLFRQILMAAVCAGIAAGVVLTAVQMFKVLPLIAAGFVAFSLAPAAGLPLGLPGMAAAALEARQIWWVCTVAATAAGLALLAFPPAWWPALPLSRLFWPRMWSVRPAALIMGKHCRLNWPPRS